MSPAYGLPANAMRWQSGHSDHLIDRALPAEPVSPPTHLIGYRCSNESLTSWEQELSSLTAAAEPVPLGLAGSPQNQKRQPERFFRALEGPYSKEVQVPR